MYEKFYSCILLLLLLFTWPCVKERDKLTFVSVLTEVSVNSRSVNSGLRVREYVEARIEPVVFSDSPVYKLTNSQTYSNESAVYSERVEEIVNAFLSLKAGRGNKEAHTLCTSQANLVSLFLMFL